MRNSFTFKGNAKKRPYYLIVRNHKTATYSGKNLTILEPKIWWKKLPTNLKSLTSTKKVKGIYKNVA